MTMRFVLQCQTPDFTWNDWRPVNDAIEAGEIAYAMRHVAREWRMVQVVWSTYVPENVSCAFCRSVITKNSIGPWVSPADGISCPTTSGEIAGHIPG